MDQASAPSTDGSPAAAQVTLADDVLEVLRARIGASDEAQVTVTRQRHGLTRFANSFIHQHVGEDTVSAVLRVCLDGRTGSGTTSDLTPDGIGRLVDDLVAGVRLLPVDDGWPGLPPPADGARAQRHDEATAEADPADRAALVRTFIEAGEGLLGAGYCETIGLWSGLSTTSGHRIGSSATRATLDGIHQTDDSAGNGHDTAIGLGALDAEAVGRQAARRARDARDAGEIEARPWEVVLAPEAVATILIFLGYYGFNGKFGNEGQSFVRPGEAQFDPSVTIVDGMDDARVSALTFDAEGTPRAGTTLVRDGVSKGFLHDRRTARVAGVTTTGNALPGGEQYGAYPITMRLSPGSATPEQLLADVRDGLYISTFNYCRVLDPKTLVVTGLTRNGTFAVRDGERVGAVSNLRFTASFHDALGPGNVLGIADDDRYADAEFGPGQTIAPHVRLRAFNITGGASG